MARVSRTQKAPQPVAPRTPLNPERIAAAALALIDRDGLDALSMRRLGHELGVEAMALYHHFPSKGRLLDAVMDLLVAEVEVPVPGTMPALERMRLTLGRYRQLAVRHPAAFSLLAGRRFNSPGAFAFYEQVLGILAEMGLNPRQSARWFRTLGYFLSGAGLADIASRELERDATRLALQHAPQTIPLPHVAAVAPYLRVDQLDDVFDFGVQVLLGALQEEITRPRARGPSSARRRAG